IAEPYTAPLLANVQRRSPVVAFSAKMIPSIVPPNTTLPAVLIKPPHGGVTTLCSHLIVPVEGSMAIALPQLSSGANRGGRRNCGACGAPVSSVVGWRTSFLV